MLRALAHVVQRVYAHVGSMFCVCLTLMHTVMSCPGKKPTKGELVKMDIMQTKEKSEKLSQKGLDAYVLQMIERDYSDSTKTEVRMNMCLYMHLHCTCIQYVLTQNDLGIE